jgi:hypothetical protein
LPLGEFMLRVLRLQTANYCREIEKHLCQKNDGHLIRIAGPSFDLVTGWEAQGVPLKVALRGIDRYFERYYARGPRRRPVRIDFCEADVLDVFDEWRRALGLPAARPPADVAAGMDAAPARHGASLPAHIARAVIRLTNARATGALGADADDLVDRISRELDAARASSRGLRGDARRALLERLTALDAELVAMARAALGDSERQAFEREASVDLAGFRDAMTAQAYQRAREAAIDRLARERFGLPTLSFV